MKINKYVRKSLKVLLWIIASVIGLVVLIVVLIQVPAVQNFAKDKVIAYVQEKIETPVRLNRIEIGFPKKLILEGIFLQDQSGDTLLLGNKIAVDISLLKLLDNQVEINSVDLQGIVAHITRDQDSIFNFDYIAEAFASNKPADTTSAPMKISIKKINLDKIKVRFDDKITKNDLAFQIEHFDTNITKFDLVNTEFAIPQITLDGLRVNLKQGELVREIGETTAKVADSIAKKPNFKIDLGIVDFKNLAVTYDNAGTRLDTGLSLDKLFVKFNTTDMQQQIIEIDDFQLDGLKGKLVLEKYKMAPRADAAEIASAPLPNNWKVTVKSTAITNIKFKFDDENSRRVARGIDYKHMDLQDFNLLASHLDYKANAMSGTIDSFNIIEGSGLIVESLKTRFFYGEQTAYLKDLYLKTPQTLLKDEIIVKYESLSALTDDLENVEISATLDGSRVGFKDVLLFVPTLANTNPFRSNPNAIMAINGQVNGKINNIVIPNLEISGIGSTKLTASGRITGLPNVEKAYFDLTIRDFKTTSRDIAMLVPLGTLPSNLQLPNQVALRGTFKGAINNFNTNLHLNTSSGNAKIKAAFDQRTKNRERYNADVVLDNFDLGRLLRNDSIGRISLDAKIKGVGLDPKTADATLDGKIIKADFNKYTYRDLALQGAIKNSQYDISANMDDPNLTFDLAASGGFEDKFPSVKLKLNVDIADLEKLNLHAGVLKMRGVVDADFSNTNPDFLNGKLNAYNFVVATEKDQFILDTISLVAVSTSEIDSMSLRSQFVNADIRGTYELTKVGQALSNSISKYYNTGSLATIAVSNQQFEFNIRVNDDPIIEKLIPQITRLEPIVIEGRYNSDGDSIQINGNIPRLVYGANTISGAQLVVDTKDEALTYNLKVDQVENEQFQLPNTTLSGDVKDDVLSYDLKIRGLDDKERYSIAGDLSAKDGHSEINLNPNGLVLNYGQWNIDPNNILRFGENGIYANNFKLEGDGSQIKIQSASDSPNAPLNIEFNDFDIETITAIIQKEGEKGLSMGGKINGDAEIRNLTTTAEFIADLTIENFTFRTDTVGNIGIKVDNKVANTFNANIEIDGQGNQVNLDGFYRTDNSSFDLNLDMERLNLKSIQGFTMGNMTNSSGYLSSKMKITGTTEAPNIRGKLKFNDGAFTITPLNSAFKLINDEISFTDAGMVFTRFTLADDNDNLLRINGSVLTQTYRDFGFDLDITADNFRAINSTSKDNELYYGKLFIDTRLKVSGTLEAPVVGGTLRINEETDLSVVLPQSDPSVVDREGIIEFVDQDNPQLTEKLNKDLEGLAQSDYKGMDINVNIDIVEEAKLSLVVDKGNGDFLSLKGEGRLSGGIDPSGKTSLTGRYEINEGAYEMSFNFIRRKFDIKKGSYIIWNGEPTDANINVTAIYTANTAPIDLVGDQLGGVSSAVRNTYKQRLPFETELKMSGELLKPTITFDIVLPEGNYSVSSDIVETSRAKLAELRQQPSELNKQVFALLLLNRFIGENPFASEAGSASAETLARQSVSKILSQQLNDFAGDLISGVELNFDLESTEDYTTGQREDRTDLNVGITKRLLDDRLKVSVGSSFGLEGPQQSNQEATNIAGDISVDYQLTKDGRYLIRAYRRDEYKVALQGQVVETGVAFIITMDYDDFKELFQRTKEEKREARALKRREEKLKEEELKKAAQELQEEKEEIEKKDTKDE